MVLKESYNMKVPPITTVSSTDFTIVPAPVNISIVLMKIVKLLEVTSLNALSDYDINQLWLPLVVYDNTDQKKQPDLTLHWAQPAVTYFLIINMLYLFFMKYRQS